MTHLAESAAIILGASEWPKYPSFEKHPGFQKSAQFFADYLLQHGLLRENLLPLFDDGEQPGIIVEKIAEFLRARVSDSLRNVLFYYVGHGGYRNNNYYVALKCTNAENLDLTMLPIRQIARVLGEETSDKRQILIIDACYAAGAVKDFIYQSSNGFAEDVSREVREYLPETNIERGASLFCAAGPTIKAKAPWEDDFTMFTGALRSVLVEGDPDSDEFLSLAKVAELVEKSIRATFREEGVRPELHTPQQDRGDIRTLPLFPNPAAKQHDSPRLRALNEEINRIRLSLRHELAWERESRKAGWYDFFELRKEIDQFGDLAQRHRIVGVHGPERGEIATIPYEFRAMPEFGTAVLDRIEDEQQSLDVPGLPGPGMHISGNLTLKPPATQATTHKGFTVETHLINSFAMTTLDAKLRKHEEWERTGMRARFPARILRLVVWFPDGYAPVEPPRVTASLEKAGASFPIERWPEDTEETKRVLPGFLYDRARCCAILNVERALPTFNYVISWKLPAPPSSQLTDAIRAKEQVRGLLDLGKRDRERLDARLESIRDNVGKTHLGWPKKRRPRTVDLSLFAFDEDRGCARVVCATFVDSPRRDVKLPWGTGGVGWTMRRRRPRFVNVKDTREGGIYHSVPGIDEHFVLCVPIPLPSETSRRAELLHDPSVPCAVAALSCGDHSGNLERLKGTDEMGTVSDELLEKILEMVTRTPL
jgi:hypothetical protein